MNKWKIALADFNIWNLCGGIFIIQIHKKLSFFHVVLTQIKRKLFSTLPNGSLTTPTCYCMVSCAFKKGDRKLLTFKI